MGLERQSMSIRLQDWGLENPLYLNRSCTILLYNKDESTFLGGFGEEVIGNQFYGFGF